MVATQLNHNVVDIEAAHGLTNAERIHLRKELCALGPLAKLEYFEHSVKLFLASLHSPAVADLRNQVRELQAELFSATNHLQEDFRALYLHEKREMMDELVAKDFDAEASARKIVAELLDKGLITESCGMFQATLHVEHVVLHI